MVQISPVLSRSYFAADTIAAVYYFSVDVNISNNR